MAEWPEQLTPELREVLGLMCFTTGPIARGFRAAGEEIERNVEAEQAFVLHWLIGLALQHGPAWRSIAGARVAELMKQVKEPT
jgi:hypothetical protein